MRSSYEQAYEALAAVAREPRNAQIRVDAMPDLSGIIIRIYYDDRQQAGIQIATAGVDALIADFVEMRKRLQP